MAKDAFEEAGEQFRRQREHLQQAKAAKDAARDEAAKSLPQIAEFCKQGIEKFYKDVKSQVCVQLTSECVRICFLRRGGRMLPDHGGTPRPEMIGPTATIAVNDGGELYWGAEEGWIKPDADRPVSEGFKLDPTKWAEVLTMNLIAFLKNTEAADDSYIYM